MEVHYKGGAREMIPFGSDDALYEAMKERLQHPDVVNVTVHKVGSTMSQNGKRYVLNALGQWERVGKKSRHRSGESAKTMGDPS